jgi:hypothetical protein
MEFSSVLPKQAVPAESLLVKILDEDEHNIQYKWILLFPFSIFSNSVTI